MNIKKSTLVFGIVILGIIVLAVWARMSIAQGDQNVSEYSAVYLTTGDIYFGKLSWFPVPHLTHVLVIQRGTDAQNQPQFGVAPFQAALWGPTDRINFNPKEIVFWTRLRNDSQIAQALQNPASMQPSGASPEGQNPAVAPQGATVPPKK